MSRITRIVVPTDFRAAAEIAVSYAIDLAAREGATIYLLHVIGDLALTAASADALAIELPGLQERLVADAQRRLDQVAAASQAAPVPVTAEVLVGHVAPVITRTAADLGGRSDRHGHPRPQRARARPPSTRLWRAIWSPDPRAPWLERKSRRFSGISAGCRPQRAIDR
jgi:nucleotide-binding universal stress UspA family protein